MCAIAGVLQTGVCDLDDPAQVVAAMADVQRHRGPDGSGTWQDGSGRLALSHCRLKVVDLSEAGHQPMASPSERFTIVFNGEIYNHREVKVELDRLSPQRWRGHSDTEILVAAFDHWGIRSTLERCTGMFAMAVWDRLERTLTLARDRMGEKPLYHGWCGATFVFASELKAFRAFPSFDASIDTDALAKYLWFGYVPAWHSIYRSVRKLMPGTILTVDEQGKTSEQSYWSLDATLRQPRFAGSPEEAAEEVERLLDRAVRRQCTADVPVGAFLSGGIDSSIIVALMRNATGRVNTFSIGFEDNTFNEAPYAASVAMHLGTEHEEMVVTAQDALALIPRLPHIWDEPMGDSSQIPTALLSILARRQVTVSLTGDGGDELFLGYPWYRRVERVERIPVKRALAAALKLAAPVAPVHLRRRLRNVGHRLTLAGAQERHLSIMAGWDGERSLVLGSDASPLPARAFPHPPGVDLPTLIAAVDAGTYLVDDLLVKADRAAMAASLETRMPFLDHHVVELACRLPAAVKLNRGQSKWPLREILGKHVPPPLFDRPKQGFAIPVADWLRGPLREWAGDLLSGQGLADSPLDGRRVTRLWDEHRVADYDHSRVLWSILMFVAWQEANRG